MQAGRSAFSRHSRWIGCFLFHIASSFLSADYALPVAMARFNTLITGFLSQISLGCFDVHAVTEGGPPGLLVEFGNLLGKLRAVS